MSGPEIAPGDSGDASVDSDTRPSLDDDPGAGVASTNPVTEEQQWHWDGEQWQPGDGPDGPQEQTVGHLSHDGQWLWDGSGWQQVQR